METTNQNPDLLDFFKIHAEHQILKYAASKQQFCQACQTILDYKKTVMVEMNSGNMMIICKKCFDTPRVQGVINSEMGKKVIKEITQYRKA
jgi:RNase P subunit RPR2